MNILVVCTANICRSPAGQIFLRDSLQGQRVSVDSAGTLALDGNAADKTIQELMVERGHPEIVGHRSRALLPHHLTTYQLILCMDRSHLEKVHQMSLSTVGKTMLFGRWAEGKEVEDPVGRSLETYSNCLENMYTYSRQWARKITDMGLVE